MKSTTHVGFKRMVLGLPQNMANHAGVDAAVDLADLLNIELLGTFVADASLRAFAGSLAVRELRVLDQEWQPIDLARISQDLESAANIARRCFAESTKSCTIKTRFDVVGDIDVIASLIRANDVVAIIEPTHPGERITRQFTGLFDAAFETAAAVLVVPRRIDRTAGPVAAVAAGPEDPSIRVGLEIAAALDERLIIEIPLGAALPNEFLTDAEQLGVQLEQITATELGNRASAVALFSRRPRERLRVITCSWPSNDVARLFSTLHRIPLLIVHPDRAKIAAGQDRRER